MQNLPFYSPSWWSDALDFADRRSLAKTAKITLHHEYQPQFWSARPWIVMQARTSRSLTLHQICFEIHQELAIILAFMVIWRLDLAVSQIADHAYLLAKPYRIGHQKSAPASNPSCIGLNILLMVLYRPINFFWQYHHGYSVHGLTQIQKTRPNTSYPWIAPQVLGLQHPAFDSW